MTHPLDTLKHKFPDADVVRNLMSPAATATLVEGLTVHLYESRDHTGSTSLCTVSLGGLELGYAHERSADDAMDKAFTRAVRKFDELLRGKS
jgi:hypothetical protein